MNDELAQKLVDELVKIRAIAIPSINPDPDQTIQAHRDQLAAQQRAADQLVVAPAALVNVTRKLARATWVLVALTVVMAAAQIIALWKGVL